MKRNSDNFHQSSIKGVMKRSKVKDVTAIIHELMLETGREFWVSIVVDNREMFKTKDNTIIANRYDSCLEDMKDKVYSCDLFGKD